MVKRKQRRAIMSGEELQVCLDSAGLSQLAYADLIDVSPGQVAKRRSGLSGVPLEGAILLRLLKEYPKLVKEAWALAGMPEGRRVAPEGGQFKDPVKLEASIKARAAESLGKKPKKVSV